jgi:hypothetical protein
MCMAAVAIVGLAMSNEAQGQTVATGQRIEVAQSTAEKLSKALPIVGMHQPRLAKMPKICSSTFCRSRLVSCVATS